MGTALLNLATRLIVVSEPPTGPPVLLENLSGQGLRLDWQAEKMRGGDPDSASLSIYNLHFGWRAALQASWATFSTMTIQLFVGWSGIPELLFRGDVWHFVAEQVSGADIITTIQARDGGAALRDTPPGGSTAVGLGIKLAVKLILKAMRIPAGPTALAAIDLAAAGNFAAETLQHVDTVGPGEALDLYMASIGLAWGLADGFFVVYRGGLRDDVLPVLLAPTSGLLEWRVVDDGGVEFLALTNVAVVPGCQVTLLDPSGVVIGGGPLRIDQVAFSGSTEGQSTMSATARKVVIL